MDNKTHEALKGIIGAIKVYQWKPTPELKQAIKQVENWIEKGGDNYEKRKIA